MQLNFNPIDISAPSFKANPWPVFRTLRDTQPVAVISAMTHKRAYFVTRHEDVTNALQDARLVKNTRSIPPLPGQPVPKPTWMPPMFAPMRENMLDLDAPQHTRLRALVHKAFTPRMVEAMRGSVSTRSTQLIDALETTIRREGSADFVARFALQLPVQVICDLLGVPAHDRGQFHVWSAAITSSNSMLDGLRSIAPMLSFMRYARRLIALKRSQPADDLTTALVQAEADGDRMSNDELVAMLLILLIAGHETTVNLLGSGMLALMQHPGQAKLLRDSPALMRPAIEELLRFTAPVDCATERFASEAFEISGVEIPRGGMVLASLGSASHDERMIADPERLDITREPNRIVNFGMGAHYCVGAPLARMEAHIGFAQLLARLPTLRLAMPAEQLRWRKSPVLRGLRALPVKC